MCWWSSVFFSTDSFSSLSSSVADVSLSCADFTSCSFWWRLSKAEECSFASAAFVSVCFYQVRKELRVRRFNAWDHSEDTGPHKREMVAAALPTWTLDLRADNSSFSCLICSSWACYERQFFIRYHRIQYSMSDSTGYLHLPLPLTLSPSQTAPSARWGSCSMSHSPVSENLPSN